jgi:hypothetical protein
MILHSKKECIQTVFLVVQPHWGVDFKQILPYQIENAKKLIESGGDLILGHGPHTIQKIGYYNRKFIVYSMGNDVFNSDGEFAKHGALPYGFFTRVKVQKNGGIDLVLIPFYNDNLETFWCPKLVNDSQFEEIIMYLGQGNELANIDWVNKHIIFNLESGEN